MKKLVILLVITGIWTRLDGQVLINLQLPPSGLTVKNQLWNFSLINTGTANVNIKVQVIVRDASNNQQVLTGTSKTFVLSRGIKQIQYADVMPVTYNINNSGYGVDASADGFLPVGVFSICFTVIQFISDASDNVAEECETIEIEPISPPMLIIPADSERVEITRPFFTWTPPVPFNLFKNLLYDWTLVEVLPLQTGAVAVQQNFPLLTQTNLSASNFQYPVASAELDTGKLYAWQVTAKNNNSAIGKSEAWVFRVSKFAIDTSTHLQQGYYVKLIRENNAPYAICNGIVKYEYLNEVNDTTVTIVLHDLSNPALPVVIPENNQPKVRYGQNFMQWDLSNASGVLDKHIYLLELRNSKKEKWFMKFQYLQPQHSEL